MANNFEAFLDNEDVESVANNVLGAVEPGARAIISIAVSGGLDQESADNMIHTSAVFALSLYLSGVAAVAIGRTAEPSEEEQDSIMVFQEAVMGKVFKGLNEIVQKASVPPAEPEKKLYIPGKG